MPWRFLRYRKSCVLAFTLTIPPATKTLLIGLLLALLILACDSYQPTPNANALIQLPFENSLDNIGTAMIVGKVLEGNVGYSASPQGKAIHMQGDGGWVEFGPASTIRLHRSIEVSFDFKRDNWDNPYKKGSVLQTIATLSGKGQDRIEHLSFAFTPGNHLSFSIYFRDRQGNRHNMRTPPGVVTLDWHQVRLEIDTEAQETRLYIDNELRDREEAIPSIVVHGIDRVKLGTWYKRNQAYRGLVDNFMVLDKSG